MLKFVGEFLPQVWFLPLLRMRRVRPILICQRMECRIVAYNTGPVDSLINDIMHYKV